MIDVENILEIITIISAEGLVGKTNLFDTVFQVNLISNIYYNKHNN